LEETVAANNYNKALTSLRGRRKVLWWELLVEKVGFHPGKKEKRSYG